MRKLISSGSPLEKEIGYSRAVVFNGMVHVSGCTAQGPEGQIMFPDDAYEQTKFALAKVERALGSAGSSLPNLVTTRVYLTRESDWNDVMRAHGEILGEIRPSSSMVQVVRLLKPGLLVEIEAVAGVQTTP